MPTYLHSLANRIIARQQSRQGTDPQPLDRVLKDYDLAAFSDATELADALANAPEAQSQLAALIDYTPSAWLVERELDEIQRRRDTFGFEPVATGPTDEPFARAFASHLIGLCFSGGGIRSATFNLGVLQGLSELNLLRYVDYLSSVSGGGYIHEWFAGWLRRLTKPSDMPEASNDPRVAFDTVAEALKPRSARRTGTEPAPILWLRRYSNYLTPKRGALSADSWVAVAVWLRNTLLNQTAAISGLLFLLLLPHLLLTPRAGFTPLDAPAEPGRIGAVVLATIVSLLLLTGVATVLASANLSANWANVASRRLLNDVGVQACLVTPLIFWALLVALLQDDAILGDNALATWAFVIIGTLVGTVLGGLLAFRGGALTAHHHISAQYGESPATAIHAKSAGAIVEIVLFAMAGAFVGSVWILYVPPAVTHALSEALSWDAERVRFIFAPPLVVVGVLLGVVVLVGLLGRMFHDPRREWLSRAGAWCGLYSAGWLGYVGISLASAAIVHFLLRHSSAAGIPSLLTWVGMTTAGVFAGRSDDTKGPGTRPSAVSIPKEWLASIGSYVFVVGLLILIGWAAEEAFTSAAANGALALVGLFVGVLLVYLLFGWRVDINEFSMHAFYRNRLTRAYLGASNTKRDPNPFTGMDPDDGKVPMASLRASSAYPGPFPIFCTALNVSGGDELAWQERKAASFAFTPLYSGYDAPWTRGSVDGSCVRVSGFADTAKYAYPPYGIHIGTAAAISGAALSPNWGYHTNPITAFLLTLFNARLGWWLLNPRAVDENGRRLGSGGTRVPAPTPRFANLQLIQELLGQSDAASRYVYLSDGGHFDNMGLYELVRRRCRFIIVSDAEQDGDGIFEGISMAIRRCRADFGVEIDLDLRALEERTAGGRSRRHAVVGTIEYPGTGAASDRRGIVVYLKSSLTGDEPADVIGYRKSHDAFPHDTTLNQWFSESQFESYRRLGLHLVRATFEPATVAAANYGQFTKRTELFQALFDIWFPPTPEMEKFHTAHTDRYEALLRRMREDEHLSSLLDTLYNPNGGVWKTKDRSLKDIAYAVSFTSEMIEFMASVHADLNLVYPANMVHPYSQGWIELFRKAATVDVVRDGWQRFGPSYSPRFQRFAIDQVGLPALMPPPPPAPPEGANERTA